MEGSNALTKENSILEQKAYLAAGQSCFLHFSAALGDLNDLVSYFVTLKLLKTPKIHTQIKTNFTSSAPSRFLNVRKGTVYEYIK